MFGEEEGSTFASGGSTLEGDGSTLDGDGSTLDGDSGFPEAMERSLAKALADKIADVESD